MKTLSIKPILTLGLLFSTIAYSCDYLDFAHINSMRSQRDISKPVYTAVVDLKEGAFESIDSLSRPKDRTVITHNHEITKPIEMDIPLRNQLVDISISNNR